MADTLAIPQLCPADHGRRMSLAEFAQLGPQNGHLYELEKGVVVMVDVPGVPHGLVFQTIRNALVLYQEQHPGTIHAIFGGAECALRMPVMQSERHPDLAIYLTPPPPDDAQPWEYWIPEIVVEVVSPGSEQRDYGIKREEYLAAGARLYWIIDPREGSVTALLRRTDTWDERRLDRAAALETPLLPAFRLPVAKLFPAQPA